jgi:hypothetical protein
VTDPMTCSNRIAFGKKVRTLAIGALATAALSIPAVSAVTVVTHDAARSVPAKSPVRFSPDSHRLALSVHPDSLRLT